MSETKFRAWDKEDKRMIVDEQDFIPLKVTNKGVLRLYPNHPEDLWCIMEEGRFEIMQSTGFQDRNGIEIYGGDIVQGRDFISSMKGLLGDLSLGLNDLYEIRYHNAAFRTFDKHGKWIAILNHHPSSYVNELKVIGNVFENPDLIN